MVFLEMQIVLSSELFKYLRFEKKGSFTNKK